MKILVVSSSLNPGSRSRRLARLLESVWVESGQMNLDFIDLAESSLPICDGSSVYGDDRVIEARERVEEASGLVFATPIYNYGVNAALKNFVELTGHGMKDKLVGFLCAAGGRGSYMSIMGLANSLMLDFRMLVFPRFVYADPTAWEGDALSEATEERLRQFAMDYEQLAGKIMV